MTTIISQAVKVLNQGGVIAYPTEYCFGLGCDPLNQDAVSRVLKIKGRSSDQGLLLIACLLYTSPSPRDQRGSRMPSSA